MALYYAEGTGFQQVYCRRHTLSRGGAAYFLVAVVVSCDILSFPHFGRRHAPLPLRTNQACTHAPSTPRLQRLFYQFSPSPPSLPPSLPPPLSPHPTGRSNMAPQMLGNFFSPKKATPPAPSTPTPTGKASTGRLNIKSIPKEAPPAPTKLASISAGVKMPAFSFGAKKPAASAEPTARVVNGKLQVWRRDGGKERGS